MTRRDPLAAFWVDDIEIDRRLGSGERGEMFAKDTEDGTETVRGRWDLGSGQKTTASADTSDGTGPVFLPKTVADIPVGSRVRQVGGKWTTVRTMRRQTGRGPEHIELGVST